MVDAADEATPDAECIRCCHTWKESSFVATLIDAFDLTRFEFPRARPIGDSQVRIDTHYIGTLELHDQHGRTGLGSFGALLFPLPPLAELERAFRTEVWPSLRGQPAAVLLHHMSRPRGGNIRGTLVGQAVDQALWDLHGQELDLPLDRLLGGTSNRVRAYASGLDFHLSLEDTCAFCAAARTPGFSAFKVKVGHPDLAWDLERLQAIRTVLGPEA